jgi:hypothetical protein
MKAPRIDPELRELLGLSLLAVGGCGLALSQGRLVVRRYLWRRLCSGDYRGDTTFALRKSIPGEPRVVSFARSDRVVSA